MALQGVGAISASQIRTELAGSGPLSLDAASSRSLAGKTSGIIKYSDFYGKSSARYFLATYVESSPQIGGSFAGKIVTDSSENLYFLHNGIYREPNIIKYSPDGTLISAISARSSSITATQSYATDIAINGNTLYLGATDNSSPNAVAGYFTLNSSLALTDFKLTTYSNPQTKLQVDSSGNLYVLCRNSTTGAYFSDVHKFNSNGTLLWKYRYTCPAGAFANDFALDSSNNLYLVGTVNTSTNNSGFMLKINSSGSIVWSKQVKFTSPTQGSVPQGWNNITINSSGIYVSAGLFGSSPSYVYCMFKFDENGNIISSKGYINPYGYYAVTNSDSNGVYLADSGGCVVRLDNNLNLLWCNQLKQTAGTQWGGTRAIDFKGIKRLSSGAIAIGGQISTFQGPAAIIGSLPEDGSRNNGSSISISTTSPYGNYTFTYTAVTGITSGDLSSYYAVSDPGFTTSATSKTLSTGAYSSVNMTGVTGGPVTI